MASWWLNLPRHAQLTEDVSDETAVFREHLLKPLAAVDSDIEKILLQDAFVHVFTITPGNPVKSDKVQRVVEPVRQELEEAEKRVTVQIYSVFASVFNGDEAGSDGIFGVNESSEESPDDKQKEDIEGAAALKKWYEALPDDKRNYTFDGDAGKLIRRCREEEIDIKTLGSISEDIVAMKIDSWADELVLIFKGRLYSARNSVESHKTDISPPPQIDIVPTPPGAVRLTITSGAELSERILDHIEELGQNAVVMENMLNATMDQLGRSLDAA